ncbi:hypothetical protein E4T45_14415, partial [Aureobasidium sp. EXF-8846]
MSDFEGEKFFLDYWQFDEQAFNSMKVDKPPNARRSIYSAALLSNISNVEGLLPPLLLHADSQQFVPRFFGRALSERAYQCPTGTNSCASIGYPNSCCTTGETCISLPENDGATIGCCPDGASCGGQIGSCDTAAGYTNCENENGGCCACMRQPLQPPLHCQYPSSSGQGPLTCSPGFQTCPASLGGGCCHTDRACGSLTCPPLSTAAPPVLPTSGSGPVSSSVRSSSSEPRRTTSTSSTVTYSGCPTGFYMCSAYYLGGC